MARRASASSADAAVEPVKDAPLHETPQGVTRQPRIGIRLALGEEETSDLRHRSHTEAIEKIDQASIAFRQLESKLLKLPRGGTVSRFNDSLRPVQDPT